MTELHYDISRCPGSDDPLCQRCARMRQRDRDGDAVLISTFKDPPITNGECGYFIREALNND